MQIVVQNIGEHKWKLFTFTLREQFNFPYSSTSHVSFYGW